MLITEEDAKTKWCPHIRMFDMAEWKDQGADEATIDEVPYPSLPVGFNRMRLGGGNETSEDQATGLSCIGSDCMMWQWADDAFGGVLRPGMTGYCGLSRVPQPTP